MPARVDAVTFHVVGAFAAGSEDLCGRVWPRLLFHELDRLSLLSFTEGICGSETARQCRE